MFYKFIGVARNIPKEQCRMGLGSLRIPVRSGQNEISKMKHVKQSNVTRKK